MNRNDKMTKQWWQVRLPWLLSGLGGGLALVALMRIPGEGISVQRLALAGTLLLGGVACFSGVFVRWEKHAWATWLWKQRWLNGVILLALALGWLALFLPEYWFGVGMAYAQRLRPLVLWVGWVGVLAALIRFDVWQAGRSALAALRAEPLQFWWLVAGIVGVFVLVVGLGRITGLGVKADDRFWNEAGAPVLGVQVLIGLVAAWGMARWGGRTRWWAWAAGLALWLAAVVIWSAQPMLPSYFAPGPYPPSNQFYPYSDAALYDVGAQYVLLGRGILNHQYMDKPLYVAMLSMFHAFAGQRYQAVIFVQILLLAFLPVVLFVLGKSLRGVGLGAFLGVLMIFKERNAIAATLDIQVSHSKLMMAELPVALALAGLALTGFFWLRQPQHGKRWAVLAGALAGAAVLIRPNAFLAVVALVVLWLLARWRPDGWRRSLVALGLFAVVFGVCFLPWMMNTPAGMEQPYLVLKIRQIIETRYQAPTSGNGHNNLVVAPLKEHINEAGIGGVFYNQAMLQQMLEDGQKSLVWALVNHWLHNQWLTVLSLPNTFALKDLSHTLQAPYWQDVRSWDGTLDWEQTLLTWGNLVLVALGIGDAWRRWRWAGVLPLAMQLGYFLANGLARNSGARYLVAVDWVTLIYYGWGLLMLLGWLGAHWRNGSEVDSVAPSAFPKGGLAFAAVLMLSCVSLPLLDELVPDRYGQQLDRQAVWEQLQKAGLLAEAGLDTNEGRAYFFDEALVLEGRALYPRFYYHDQGEPTSKSSGTSPLAMLYQRPYPRLTWILLSNDFYRFVLLPMNAPPSNQLPDAPDVIVLACPGEQWFAVDAQAVFILGQEPQVLLRSPQAGLRCPLPEPVCDLNHTCR